MLVNIPEIFDLMARAVSERGNIAASLSMYDGNFDIRVFPYADEPVGDDEPHADPEIDAEFTRRYSDYINREEVNICRPPVRSNWMSGG